jgi:hypothetical protein
MDRFAVRAAADETSARAALAAGLPDLLLLDATTPLTETAERWTEGVAPAVPVVVLIPGWDELPQFNRPNVAVLPMPFGREELRQALAVARGVHSDRD